MTSLFFQKHGLPMLLLVGISSFLFSPTVRTPFTYDDFPHFVKNTRVISPHSIRDIFKNGLQETRPVFNLSLALQARFFGTSAVAAHVVNIALHILTGLLLYGLIFRWKASVPLGFISAIVFLIHPISVETVAYFNSRSGLLALLFSLMALFLFMSEKKWAFVLGLICLVLAIGSKEDAIAAVLIALGAEGWRKGRSLLIGATAITLPFLYLSFRSPHIDSVGTSVAPWTTYLWHQGAIIPLHLSLFFWPWPLTLDLDLPSWLSAPGIVAMGWLLVIGLLFLAWRFRRNPFGIGLIWSLVALSPTHSVIPMLDEQAARILYSMLPGLSLLTAAGFIYLQKKWPVFGFALLIGFSSFLAFRTHQEIALWLDPVALWQRDAQEAPSRWRAWTNLTIELGERKRWPEAAEAISKAERLNPTQAEVFYNSAVIWGTRTDGLKNMELAVSKLKENLRLHPQHDRSRKLLDRLLK